MIYYLNLFVSLVSVFCGSTLFSYFIIPLIVFLIILLTFNLMKYIFKGGVS